MLNRRNSAFVLLCISIIGWHCRKTNHSGAQCNTYLTITSAITDRTTTLAAGIRAVVNSVGSDLCFHYKGMEILQQASPSGPVYQYEYFLHAKAVKDCNPEQLCAQALYEVRDTILIRPSATGTYYLNYYNQGQLFKRDTVVVN